MLRETIKKTTAVTILVLILVCSVWAEQDSVGFDPFANDSSLVVGRDKFESSPVIPQVEFNNNDISMAFQIISDATGWSIFPTFEVSKAKINLWAKNISAQQLFETIVAMAGFVYHRENDVITVMTYDEYMQHYGLAKEVFVLKFTPASSVDAAIKPFMTKLGKSVIHNQTNSIILYESHANLEYIKSVIEKLDGPSENIIVDVINLEYADSQILAEKLQQLFADKEKKQQISNSDSLAKIEGVEVPTGAGGVLSPQSEVLIQSLGRTNQLIVKAYKTDIDRLKHLIEKLDVYVDPVTKNYLLVYVDAAEIFTGLKDMLNLDGTKMNSKEGGNKSQGITLVEKTNSIVLTGPPSAHRIMLTVVESIDKPSTYETGTIRIYKLENADVEEVAKTVSTLLESNSENTNNTSNVNFAEKQMQSASTSSGSFAPSEEFVPQIEPKVSINKSTNSIVIQATTRQHRELEKLIKELDARRKQVLIEAMIVEITTTDNLDVGVELSHASLDAIAFIAFGLSTGLNPTSGTRNITVSPGGTAAILRPDKLQAILHLLKEDGNARITSAPRILVNDNATGFINSIVEEPTVQTNQGENTTTTSFAGFVEAGTQFAITPHISEKDYLRVEYQITLNSFGLKSTDPSIPPPRNTTSIQSEAAVPNGFTIIVGGLQTVDESENIDKVPILGDIPILNWVFKNTQIEKQYKTTYLFITPHIMESEDFSELKKASDDALSESEIRDIKNEKMDIADINAASR